jgi:ABC-type glycerol-3-phosphate transport system permease component
MSLIAIYPLFLMIVNSFKSNSAVLLDPAGLPQPWTLNSWANFVQQGQLRNLVNSLIVALATTAGAVAIASLAAYAFTKMRFRGRGFLFVMLLATMMVPVQVTIPPMYLLMARVHWLDTYQVQIVPFIAPVFGLFMIRQYMLSLPDSLLEAARIDGAREWRIFRSIVLPMAAPILGAFAILEFLTAWNSYLWPQVMANTHTVAPLSESLPTLTDSTEGFIPVYGTIMVGAVIATVPLILVFLRFKRTVIAGITFGAVKE